MNRIKLKSLFLAFITVATFSALQGFGQTSSSASASTDNIDSLKKMAMNLISTNDTIASHLKTFDELDFDVFSNQRRFYS